MQGTDLRMWTSPLSVSGRRSGPFSQAMRERLAGVLGLSAAEVSVKGKTNEGMGWIGAGEGLAVHAVALVEEL